MRRPRRSRWRDLVPGFRCYLANDLDRADQREEQHPVAVEISALAIGDEAPSGFRRLDHVLDAYRIL
jgi:hypothetical protein